MSLEEAALTGNYVEWRIFEFESQIESPIFLLDATGLACRAVLTPYDEKYFSLHFRFHYSIKDCEVYFICYINDDYSVKVEKHKYHEFLEVSDEIYAELSPKHTFGGKPYMSVKLRWFILDEMPSKTSVLPSTLPEQFSWLLQSQEFSDLAIETEDESRIPVHQNILAMHSPVFRAMLKSDMAECKSQCIKISDFSPETVKQMVTFIYTSQLEDVTYESAVSLLGIADKYDLKYLKQFCWRHLLMHLSNSNVMELLLLTHTYEAKIVKQIILNFISENRYEFSEPREFDCLLEADPSLFVEIITTLTGNKPEV